MAEFESCVGVVESRAKLASDDTSERIGKIDEVGHGCTPLVSRKKEKRCCNRIPVHKVGGTMGFVKAVAVSRLSCGMLARIPGGDRGIFGSHSIHRRMISLQSNCIREHNSYGRRLNVLHWGLLPFNLNAGKHSFPPSIERNETSAISFIKGGMKHHAMKLHTKSQAPAEGQGPKKEGTKKFTKWLPTRSNYLQLLVNCKLVYGSFENAIARNPCLSTLRHTGLERASALDVDIAWMLKTYPSELGTAAPKPSSEGVEYSNFIMKISEENIPRFICHYYNYHFAHIAGGIMVGTSIADAVLDCHKLEFYCWDRDIRSIKFEVNHTIEELSKGWSRQERDECIQETEQAFNFGANLLLSVS